MAAPWKASPKTIDSSGHTRHAYSGASTSFAAPAVNVTLTTSPTALFTAMAKMQALRTATPALASSLARAAALCVEAIVDDAGTDFDLAPEAESLEQTVRSALAGSVGAGMCHLFMVSLGYVWHDFAAQVMTTTGKLADFVYDGGPVSGHGVVLAEAKGSFALRTTAAAMQSRARNAYTNQVEPYIGAPITGSQSQTVVHGYAFAFGAQPPSVRPTAPAPHACIHISETDRPVATTGGTFATGGSGNSVATLVALGNYRAAFMLAGAPTVVDVIDYVRMRRRRLLPIRSYQRFSRISIGAWSFLVGVPDEGPEASAYDPVTPWGTFAIEERVAVEFLKHLSSLSQSSLSQAIDLFGRLELPVVKNRGEETAFSEPFVFPDGFALVPQRPQSPSNGEIRWSLDGSYDFT